MSDTSNPGEKKKKNNCGKIKILKKKQQIQNLVTRTVKAIPAKDTVQISEALIHKRTRLFLENFVSYCVNEQVETNKTPPSDHFGKLSLTKVNPYVQFIPKVSQFL